MASCQVLWQNHLQVRMWREREFSLFSLPLHDALREEVNEDLTGQQACVRVSVWGEGCVLRMVSNHSSSLSKKKR